MARSNAAAQLIFAISFEFISGFLNPQPKQLGEQSLHQRHQEWQLQILYCSE